MKILEFRLERAHSGKGRRLPVKKFVNVVFKIAEEIDSVSESWDLLEIFFF
jgi:hypothetical protein